MVRLTSQRRALMLAALGCTRLRWREPMPSVAAGLTRWMDSWPGLGAIAAGLHAQGYDMQLTEYPDGWRANVYPRGIAQSIVHGSGWEPTPWRAVQAAAWEALSKEVE